MEKTFLLEKMKTINALHVRNYLPPDATWCSERGESYHIIQTNLAGPMDIKALDGEALSDPEHCMHNFIKGIDEDIDG